MLLRLTAPDEDELRRVLTGLVAVEPGYPPAGTAGYRTEHVATTVPSFERTAEALRTWGVHRGAGLSLVADGPVRTGTTVVLAAPMPVAGHVLAACRVVRTFEEPDRVGFAYGTLPLHPEEGEEAFVVERNPDGTTGTFTIEVFWRAHHPLAKLAGPVAKVLQRRATRRYLEAAKQPG
jgi:uncharacterized protein (UPF0548 family)